MRGVSCYNKLMPTLTPKVQSARALFDQRVDFNVFMEKLAAKDRPKIDKLMAAYELAGDQRHADLWKRLACALMTLAPHQIKVNAQQSIQFYIADGRHRKQVFALEASDTYTINVYCEDVIAQAIEARLIQPATDLGPDETTYRIVGSDDTIFIERIDGASVNPVEFFKHMVGWNRKALRIKVPVTASDAQAATAETLCAMCMPGH